MHTDVNIDGNLPQNNVNLSLTARREYIWDDRSSGEEDKINPREVKRWKKDQSVPPELSETPAVSLAVSSALLKVTFFPC